MWRVVFHFSITFIVFFMTIKRSLFYLVLFYVWFALVFNHFNSNSTFLNCQDFSHLDIFFIGTKYCFTSN